MDIFTTIGQYFLPLLRDSIIATLIGFALGWLGRTIVDLFRYRKARSFWKPYVKGDLHVVAGRFLEFSSFEESGFLGVGDAVALSELRTFFKKLGLADFDISYADQLIGDALKTNLILIGGPDANSITNKALSKIHTDIRFGNPEVYQIAMYDAKKKQWYMPKMSANAEHEIVADYGVIISTSNPFAPDKRLLLIAGSFGYGTWAGVEYAISDKFVKNKIVSQNKEIECLIEVDIERKTPLNPRPIILRKIEA